MRFAPVLMISAAVMAGSITPALRSEMTLSGSSDRIHVLILLEEQIDPVWISDVTAGMDTDTRREFVTGALLEIMDLTQVGIIEDLGGYPDEMVTDLKRLWLANAVYCRAAPEVIMSIALRDDVRLIEGACSPSGGLIGSVDTRSPTRDELDANGWGIEQINADDVWGLGYDGSGIIVGVIDTGTDYNHIDLHDNMWHDTQAGYHYGWDFYDGDADPMDDHGHGTGCSGIVLGNGTGGTQTGVAPGATCMALRIDYLSGDVSSWIQAMEFGTVNGASVLTTSVSVPQGNMTLRTAEENLLAAGVFHTVTGGGGGPGPGSILSGGDCPPPWFHPDQTHHGGQSAVVTCGATDMSDVVASFSGRGPVTWWSDYTAANPLIDPDICGPGVNIISTQLGGGYYTGSGTSSATSHLAGVAALILDANPWVTVSQIDEVIETTALELGPAGKDNSYGAGRVDAYEAVLAALALGVENSSQAAGIHGLTVSRVSPNPAGAFASFTVYSAEPGRLDVSVYDLQGRLIARIEDGETAAGMHLFRWTISPSVSNGVYFIRAAAEGSTAVSRFTVLR
jgi:serine protease AprX